MIRTTLTEGSVMRTTFDEFFSKEELHKNAKFYSYLLTYERRTVSLKEFVIILTQAIIKLYPAGYPIDIDKIIDAMVGRNGRIIGERTKRLFRDVAFEMKHISEPEFSHPVVQKHAMQKVRK